VNTRDAAGFDARAAAVRRVLADERRVRLVAELRDAGDGVDVHELARRLDVHPNTVRWHLGVLADAGLVASRPAGTRGPGRPRILYRLRPDAPTAAGDEHRVLATILTDALASVPDATRRAEAAGRAWGRDVAGPAAAPPAAAPAADAVEAAVAQTVAMLAVEGFDPVADGCSIRMHRCPFGDLAEAHTEIVCAAHRGLVAGALEALGAPLEVSTLLPFAEPNVCVLELRRRPAG
jgi:predicted ArsR family transcriptional regulator